MLFYDENEERRLTFCWTGLPEPGATGGLVDLGGDGADENACAAAATRPTFTAGAWLLLPAVWFPLALLLLPAWLIPAASMRDAAAGFAITARCAAPLIAVAWPLLPAAWFADPLALLLLLARLIPAASMRDAAAGFAITARCAAPVIAVVAADVLAGDGTGANSCVSAPAPPTLERRSGLEVKYLQERKERARIGVDSVNSSIGDVVGGATHSSRRAKKASFSCVGRLANGICSQD